MTTIKKYIDSHWLVFIFQGVIALLFGWFALFTGSGDIQALLAIVGATLLGLGIIELFNLLHRTHNQYAWGCTMAVAVLEVAVALALLFTLNQNTAWHLGIIAGYTILRGVFEILIGLRSVDDTTDRTIWVICGICGVIMGFVILNSANLGIQHIFVKFFGSYMMLFGICNLIYGVHNFDQSKAYKKERSVIAKKAHTKRKTTKRRK